MSKADDEEADKRNALNKIFNTYNKCCLTQKKEVKKISGNQHVKLCADQFKFTSRSHICACIKKPK